jgi:RNA polymerase sigma factor (sigma-70 family)
VESVERRRWQLVLPHRTYLVRIALSRGMSRDDAEDCAQEAMVRCVGFANLDEARVVEFLAATTMRLCADRYRAHAHDAKVGRKLVPWFVDEPSPEEAACNRGEAAWVARHVAALPESQRVALVAKADGLSCHEIAARMGLSYKAVESLLSRARAYVRAAVATAWVLVARLRRRGAGLRLDTPAVAVAMAAFVSSAALGPGGPATALPPAPAAARPPRAAAPPRRPLAPAVTPFRVTAEAAAPAPAPVPQPAAPDPVASPDPRPTLPIPTAIPTDPCDARVPHVDTCVPLDRYEPGAGLHRCLEYGPSVSSRGVSCRPS